MVFLLFFCAILCRENDSSSRGGQLLKLLLQLVGMNSDQLLRLSQMKQYITTLNDSITGKDHLQAVTAMSRFKKAVLKEEASQHNHQFVIDCLKAKNEKLLIEIEAMQHEKDALEQRIRNEKGSNRSMKTLKAAIFISRLTVTLNDVKKVEYEDIELTSDYSNLVINSIQGSRYKHYTLAIQSIITIDHKVNYVYLNIQEKQNLHVLVRFNTEKDAHRWVICLRFGQLLQSTRNKEKLFETPQQKQQTHHNLTATFSPVHQISHSSHAPMLQFGQKNMSPNESQISQRRSIERSGERSGDRSMEKNTERSLVNAMSFQNRDFHSNGKQVLPTFVNSKRIQNVRPSNLTRIRGQSQNLQNNSFQISKIYKSGNSRKQSEDIFKPHINQTYHEKMLQKYRSQQGLSDEIKSQQTFKKVLPEEPSSQIIDTQPSNKIKMLEEKKKELLRMSSTLASDKPAFPFESKVSWMGIEERDDQNKSKSSNRISNKSRRGSEFSQSNVRSSQFGKKDHEEEKSIHISQQSQEESPKMPAKVSYEVPHKISYANGIVFRLNPVQKGSSPSIQANSQSPSKKDLQKSQNSSSSASESEDHLDPSSHENHTESEDNTARAEQLKKGIILTKCSQKGFWHHEKILYLAENEIEICSRDIKDKKIKKIKLSNIHSIGYKQFDQGIIKHISKIEEDKCLVIQALDQDGKIKNFEYVGNLAEPLERFATNLKLFIEYSRKE